ncbi:M23 family metallopeptidase [Clostridium oryzae]|uniref:Stage II sporulation protein Q n=1 Tax=Clostridium oryzae TaxID=1450648 RepID=A0A1V4IUH9_9CLOT|nr:M23 family metallopeptidase [Clostridium oryzae]OPJ63434.1 stage II sporulation protein Q [Clostridium oryzae]
MDKKLFRKSSNFFKKEGFYVILFVCLCIVATVAVIATRNKYVADKKVSVAQKQNSKKIAKNSADTQKVKIPNALEVNKKSNTKKNISNTKNKGKKSSTAPVGKSVEYKFIRPVIGSNTATKYTTGLIKCETIGTYKTDNGIEISAKLGSKVSAVLDGKVTAIGNDETELGQYIIVDHQNGLKTVYGNLKNEIKLKVGDRVKRGEVIGEVGKTQGSYTNEKYGDHLHFEVMKDGKYVDPARYISYKTFKSN